MKAFLFEVVVIAVGVGAALGAEELISNYNKKKSADKAYKVIRNSLLTIQVNISERLAAQACTAQVLEALSEQLMREEDRWTPKVSPLKKSIDGSSYDPMIPIPFSTWEAASWQSAISSGVAANMNRSLFRELSQIYTAVDMIQHAQTEELRLLGSLGHLTQAGPLSFDQRRTTYSLLSELGVSNEIIYSVSRQLSSLIPSVVEKYPASTEKHKILETKEYISNFKNRSNIRKHYPSCYDESQWEVVLKTLDGLKKLQAN